MRNVNNTLFRMTKLSALKDKPVMQIANSKRTGRGGGTRTHNPKRRILSPLRMPIPPRSRDSFVTNAYYHSKNNNLQGFNVEVVRKFCFLQANIALREKNSL